MSSTCLSEEDLYDHIVSVSEGHEPPGEVALHLEGCVLCKKKYKELEGVEKIIHDIKSPVPRGDSECLTNAEIGNYKIHSRISKGGMGSVWLATDHMLSRQVAIKIMQKHISESETYKARFETEAKIIASLNHPNIIQVYNAGVHQDNLYIVMEYIDGDILIKEGDPALPAERAFACFKQILEGMAVAHDKNILHRDIKPSNIMITGDGVVKILDFGLAHSPDFNQNLTRTGMLMGTVAYLAPEIARGEAFSRQADIYALGVVFYEMLCGKNPFKADTPLATLEKIKTIDLIELDKSLHGIQQGIKSIIKKCCHPDLNDRYKDIQELKDDFNKALSTSQKNNSFATQTGQTAFHTIEDIPSIIAKAEAHHAKQINKLSDKEIKALAKEMGISPEAVDQAVEEFEKKKSNKKIMLFVSAIILLFIVIFVYDGLLKKTVVQKSSQKELFEVFDKQTLNLAALPFKNLSHNQKWNGIAASCADSILLSLADHKRLRLIERQQLDKVIAEIDLSQTSYIDPLYSIELGKMIGVDLTIMGSVQEALGKIQITAKIVGTEEGQILNTIIVTGQEDEIFSLQDRMARELAQLFK